MENQRSLPRRLEGARSDSVAYIFLPYEGLPLGIFATPKYRTFVARPIDGSLIVFYTDGVIEHERDIVAGRARSLEAARVAVSNESPATAVREAIFGKNVPTDDVAILTISFKTNPNGKAGMATVSDLQPNRLDVPDVRSGLGLPPDSPYPEASRDAVAELREIVRSRR